MHDEDANGKTEQTEGGQVQVKAVCQPVCARILRRLADKAGRDLCQRRQTNRLCRCDDETAERALCRKKGLRHADIRQRDAGRDAWLRDDPLRDGGFKRVGHIWCCEQDTPRQEIFEVGAVLHPHGRDGARCGQWIEAD